MLRKAAGGAVAAPVPRIVLVDANVFFAPRLRDLFMFLHAAELIYVHWTKDIEQEWARNVVENQEADPQSIDRCLRGMRDAVPGWEVAGYQKHKKLFPTVDVKDTHVAAAAYKLSLSEWPGRPVALVTKNVTDFPEEAFGKTQVTRFNMATYIDQLFAENPQEVLQVVNACRAKLKNPKHTAQMYVEALVKHGCTRLAQAAANTWGVECPMFHKNVIQYEADRVKAQRAKKKAASKKAARKKPEKKAGR